MPNSTKSAAKNSAAAKSPAAATGSAATASPAPVYKRVVLKLSGEVLAGEEDAIDSKYTRGIAAEIAEIHASGVQVCIVIGGGNIWRGLTKSHEGMDRTPAPARTAP